MAYKPQSTSIPAVTITSPPACSSAQCPPIPSSIPTTQSYFPGSRPYSQYQGCHDSKESKLAECPNGCMKKMLSTLMEDKENYGRLQL